MADDADLRFYEFGGFRLDPTGRVLYDGQRVISVPPKVADTLLLLVENAGKVVEKGELLKKVWEDAFVEEGSLTRTISILRKALGNSEEAQEYIATIPKRGYRFAVPVRRVEPSSPVADVSHAHVGSGRYKVEALALALTISVVIVAAYFSARRYSRHANGNTGRRMIAVLPFQNLTGDPGQEFVSDGLTEEMITELGALSHDQLGVIARTSAMAYKGSTKPLSEIGRKLGVDYVLEGSVRRWGKRVRISTQLIRTHDQTHIWAHNYESDAEDVLQLQSDVAREVAENISLTLTPEAQARATRASRVDPLVYELCLHGRYEWSKRTEVGIRQAIYYFQQAISRDPGYAAAYAGLADAYAVLPYYSKGLPNDTFPTVKALAEHALQLDESRAEAHATLGLVECSHLDVAAAERHYHRALELDANYATAHHWHSFCLWAMNRQNESLAELERARQLDPLSLIIYSDEARVLSALQQPERAITLLQTALELDPNFADAHRALAIAYLQSGRAIQAIAEARRGVELDENDYEQATLGYVYGVMGKTKPARAILTEFNQPGRRVALINRLVVYAGLGQREQALRVLERAYDQGDFLDPGAEPMLDPLRSDPRFENLLLRTTTNLSLSGKTPTR